MKLHFLGASRQVTGSRYYLEADGARILVDCGMFQERPFAHRNWAESPVPPSDLDAVLLTHVHVDHCGLVPRLVGAGFAGPILATRPSVALADIVLRDGAKIQREDFEYKRRRHKKEGRNGDGAGGPLYDFDDVARTLPLFEPVPYGRPVAINGNATVEFFDAGHILGSAMLRVTLGHGEDHRVFIFSGDVGQHDKPLVRDPSYFDTADYIVVESTYGDRDHQTRGSIEDELEAVISSTVAAGGKVVVPVFAIERAQEFVYHVGRLLADRRIPSVPVYLDSPMAVDVTEVFREYRDCLDAETWQLIAAGEKPLRFPELTMVRQREQSMAINRQKGPAIIMATSGMCTAGRIKHHLKHNVGDPDSTILFVGYQGRGTLGRQLLEGRSEVRIHGRNRRVGARVVQLDGLSGHADRTGLLRWLEHFKQPPRRLFVTHGDEEPATALAQTAEERWGWQTTVPELDDVVELE